MNKKGETIHEVVVKQVAGGFIVKKLGKNAKGSFAKEHVATDLGGVIQWLEGIYSICQNLGCYRTQAQQWKICHECCVGDRKRLEAEGKYPVDPGS